MWIRILAKFLTESSQNVLVMIKLEWHSTQMQHLHAKRPSHANNFNLKFCRDISHVSVSQKWNTIYQTQKFYNARQHMSYLSYLNPFNEAFGTGRCRGNGLFSWVSSLCRRDFPCYSQAPVWLLSSPPYSALSAPILHGPLSISGMVHENR